MLAKSTSTTCYVQEVQENIKCLNGRKDTLESTKITSFGAPQIFEFEENVRAWYPIYEHYGKKTYKETSVFQRALSYIPHFNANIWGFKTYTKLGEDAANLDMKKFSKFLEEDIKREIKDLASKILDEENLRDRIMG
ncbi:MAG: hypothetical protein K940chlam5_00361 [Candidatus Anoxychlamydiales bacterium]|nr:hypothetical protein [Candidatus Anoxychlamydiales bacterium]